MILNKKNPFSVIFRALLLFSTAVALILLGFKTYALKKQMTMLSEKQVFLVFKNDSLQRLLDAKTLEIDSVNKNYDSLSAGFKELTPKTRNVVAQENIEGISTGNDRLVVEVPPVVNPVIPGNKLYTVKKGDHLYQIARELYGNATKYKIIFEANQPMLKDPNLVYPGQVLIIPPPGK
jgi:nucleoid-associated protein YgaU